MPTPLLEKVFYTLIDNTLRYGGEQCTKITVASHGSGNDRVIVYEDNGAGVPEENKTKIFEKGFGKNTGLGLFFSGEILAITGITITETGTPGDRCTV